MFLEDYPTLVKARKLGEFIQSYKWNKYEYKNIFSNMRSVKHFKYPVRPYVLLHFAHLL